MQYIKYIIALVVIAGLVFAGLTALDVYTPEAFSLLAAGIVAAAFERVPWLRVEFDKLTSEKKQLYMLVFLAVIVFGAFGLSCAAVIVAFVCTGAGALHALTTLFLAAAVNQGVYALTYKSG
jgi:hypothetical protein